MRAQQHLTRDQLKALVAFAKENGRTWKSQLNQEWMNGCVYNSELIGVRNQFGPSWLVRFNLKDAQRMLTVPKCDQCQMLAINGHNTHETGCPNSKKTWVADRQAWVLYLECSICGDDVEEGEFCTCQDKPDDEEEEEQEPPDNYVDLGGACDDCVIAIANDDYTGMDDETEARVRKGLERIGEWLVVGDELGFEHSRCAVCGDLPGNRHQVGYLKEKS